MGALLKLAAVVAKWYGFWVLAEEDLGHVSDGFRVRIQRGKEESGNDSSDVGGEMLKTGRVRAVS